MKERDIPVKLEQQRHPGSARSERSGAKLFVQCLEEEGVG
jgi:hypothetical protein